VLLLLLLLPLLLKLPLLLALLQVLQLLQLASVALLQLLKLQLLQAAQQLLLEAPAALLLQLLLQFRVLLWLHAREAGAACRGLRSAAGCAQAGAPCQRPSVPNIGAAVAVPRRVAAAGEVAAALAQTAAGERREHLCCCLEGREQLLLIASRPRLCWRRGHVGPNLGGAAAPHELPLLGLLGGLLPLGLLLPLQCRLLLLGLLLCGLHGCRTSSRGALEWTHGAAGCCHGAALLLSQPAPASEPGIDRHLLRRQRCDNVVDRERCPWPLRHRA
jgi:hypothetical protein